VLQTLPDDIPDTPRVSIVKTAFITALVLLVIMALGITAIGLVTNGSSGATTAPVIAAANTATSQPATPDTAIPTDAPTQTPDQWAKDAEQLSFADVRDHPDIHYGAKVMWGCTIDKFLGTDSSDATMTDVTCERVEGTYNTPIGEFFIKVPASLNMDQAHAGDQIAVYGTVDSPAQGTNGFGGTLTEPQIDAVYVDDSTNPAPTVASGA